LVKLDAPEWAAASRHAAIKKAAGLWILLLTTRTDLYTKFRCLTSLF
jgi:hypothetical protein